MEPKPNGKWRFCIDYRNLNAATFEISWPLPNIQQTIQRIGKKRPDVYNKFDMTSGYFQMPLSQSSQIYNAFITFMGLYIWTRVPINIKGAPAFFRKQWLL